MLGIVKSYLRFLRTGASHLRHPIFERRFLAQLKGSCQNEATPLQFFSGLPDDYYFWLMAFSHTLGHRVGDLVPDMPAPHLQRNWTGASGETTFRQAFSFYTLIKDWVRQHSRKPIEQSRVLDFGCGWGRIIRFFLREVPHEQLHGCDCWEEIVNVSRTTNRWVDFKVSPVLPPLDSADGCFDLIYLFSVFSHLSEDASSAWVREFKRLLRPGGLLVTTTRPRSFILELQKDRKTNSSKGLFHSVMAIEAFPDTQAALNAYDQGEFCFSATGGGGPLSSSFYGEACIPESYAKKNWHGFELVSSRYADRMINQNVMCFRKS